jgi:hypothetical protein
MKGGTAKIMSQFATARIAKIISGGQTGADRMALDFAIWHDISPWRLVSERPESRGRSDRRQIRSD